MSESTPSARRGLRRIFRRSADVPATVATGSRRNPNVSTGLSARDIAVVRHTSRGI